jgi:hypothetical protein
MAKRIFTIYCTVLILIFLSSCQSLTTKLGIIPKKESQEEYLEKIYSSGEPQKLREIFNHYTNELDFSKEEDNKAVNGIAKYINLFPNKFIVIEEKEKEGPSCNKANYFTILIESHSKNILAWGVYIYPDKKKRNRICRIKNFGQREEFNFLRKYQKYWI